MLAALLARSGAHVTDLGILRDEPGDLARRLRAATVAHDLVLTSGGVSTGEEDHVRAAVAAVGSLVLWRLAIKPGRPIAMGVVDGVPVVGLPGNPVAVFVTYAEIVRPLLARLAGDATQGPAPRRVRLRFAYAKKAGRREYVRVRLAPGPDGATEAHRHMQDGAGLLTSLTQTDGLVALPEAWTDVAEGSIAPALVYGELY